MKVYLSCGLVALALALGACSKSSSTNPSTSNLEDLNPPGGLITVTHDGSIELRWKAANAEKDFVGYDVFVTAAKVTDVGAPAYPSAAKDLTVDSVPRCKDNSAIFKKFGMPDAVDDCSGDPNPTGSSSSSAAATTTPAASTNPDETPITVMSICDENGADKTLSLTPKALPALGTVVCTIKTMTDATGKTAALVNGTTYTFFVVAVKGDAKDSISWASNFVQDTPAVQFYDNKAFALALGTSTTGQVWVLPVAKLATITTGKALTGDLTPFDATKTCADFTAPNSVCKVNNTNNSLASDGLYFGRLGTGNYPERAFLSAPAGGAIQLQSRGPQIYDPMDGTAKVSIPGDQATTSYNATGKLYPLYGNEVFDFQYTDPTSKSVYFGKLVFGTASLKTPADPTTDLQVPLTIIMQSQAASHDYFNAPNPREGL